MTVELTQEVSSRLESDLYGWLTTVAKSGQPVPRLVWFHFDGTDLTVYSMPNAAKVPYQRASAGEPESGFGRQRRRDHHRWRQCGSAAVVEVGVDGRKDGPFWEKYKEDAERYGLSEDFAAYSTRLRIGIDKVWTTPPRASFLPRVRRHAGKWGHVCSR